MFAGGGLGLERASEPRDARLGVPVERARGGIADDFAAVTAPRSLQGAVLHSRGSRPRGSNGTHFVSPSGMA